jgi:hypothetical protein
MDMQVILMWRDEGPLNVHFVAGGSTDAKILRTTQLKHPLPRYTYIYDVSRHCSTFVLR